MRSPPTIPRSTERPSLRSAASRPRPPVQFVPATWSLSRNRFRTGDVYTTTIWIPFVGDAPGGRMRTNHSAATRAHRVSRALSSTKNPMSSAEPHNHDRILWLGLLALLLAAACGTSANPGPGTPDPIRTYRIRRLADSPVARNGHVAIGLADGSALVMGGNSSEAINLPDSSSTQRLDSTTEAFT